jgi:predicted amidohydrolase YtcJ
MWNVSRRAVLKGAGVGGAGLVLGAARGTDSFGATSFLSAPADTILLNGKILTVDQNFSIAQAIAIKDGMIAAVGTNDEISRWWGADTLEIDLQHKTVIPGIIDGHSHLAVDGLRYVYPSLASARSVEDVVRIIEREVQRSKPGEWVVTAPLGEPPSYDNVLTLLKEKRFPNRWDLDKVSPNNPVYIKPPWSWWNRPPVVSIANSYALRLAGVTKETKAPYPGITIDKDPASGEPTGIIIEDHPLGLLHAAQDFSLMKVAPRFTHGDRMNAFKHSLRTFNSAGTTSIYEGHGIATDILRVFKEFYAASNLTMRSYLVLSPPAQRSITDYEPMMRDWAMHAAGTGFGDNVLKVGGVFIVWGGDAEVARLRAQEEPYTGYSDWYVDATTPEKYRNMVFLAAKYGLRVNTVASTQAALDGILTVFEEVNATYPIAGRRWVLQHLYEMNPPSVARMKKLGIVPTILPVGQLFKGAARFERTPKERRAHICPYRSVMNAGLPLASGTDGVPPSPFAALWATIARQAETTGEVLNPAQRLRREDALRTMTINAAYLCFEENNKGSIEVGKYADLAILDRDYLTAPQDEIKDTQATMMMLGGKIIHQR